MQDERSNEKSATVSGETRLSQALGLIPGALEYIVSLNPHDFGRLHNPFMRKYMSPRISLRRVAAMAGIPEAQLLQGLSSLNGSEAARPASGELSGEHSRRSAGTGTSLL